MEIVFLHGLESATDETGVPVGSKASFLRERYAANLVALDTRVAVDVAARCERERPEGWTYPYPGYDDAFATPMARARAALTLSTQLVIGSSFGGAVLLRLLHEGGWSGPSLFLAGAGPKLTPYRTLPAGVRALLVHGTADEVVSIEDSRALVRTSDQAALWEVDDGHRLASVLTDETLERAIAWCVSQDA
jgi:pimeloyl-ACP methyl ester carboxylesterase